LLLAPRLTQATVAWSMPTMGIPELGDQIRSETGNLEPL
jgi:hypothetical protein